MKEATGEGSMTIVTIVIIVALAAAAAIVVGIIATKARSSADTAGADYECTETNSKISCSKKQTQNSTPTVTG